MSDPQTRHRILIVDDEEKIRSILARHLSDESCECVEADNAVAALNHIKYEPQFSLVITDIVMPGLSGLELLRRIKKIDPDLEAIMITGVTDLATAVDSIRLGACDYITKPFDLPTLRKAVDAALERRRLILENRSYQQELETKVRERTAELNGALLEIEQSYRITLEALVTALDAREHETQAHSQRVRAYTLLLAKQFALDDSDLIQLGRGALLHDVGKIGVPDSILLKPAKLTPQEWIEMRKHPQIGYEILQNIKFLSQAGMIVLCHQEKWDGTGYPNNLAKDEIPLGARIFAVADTLDAMTSNRPYRKALSFETAVHEITRCSGAQFDPQVVEAFLSLPAEAWLSTQDAVNRNHRAQDTIDLICRT
jgi:response regulator RpfG family c-di-GMP phosphodiesterase